MKTASVVAFLLLAICSSACGQALEWTRQLGTSNNDISWDVSADGLGNVYISGLTAGSLEGANAGDDDAFISKYDASGTLQWTQQFGTGADDRSRGVSADGLGNIYVSGWTLGNLEGSNAGDWDAFVSKYDAGGTVQWTQQLGTSSLDLSYDASVDGLGNVYISGSTKGNLEGVNAGNHDAFVSKYDAGGMLLWTRQLGTSDFDIGWNVSADGLGSVYISGRTRGSLAGSTAGRDDAFISKYDGGGTLQWTRQIGTSSVDSGYGVSADGLGNVYISGITEGNLNGANAGEEDVFVSKFDNDGTLQWTRQLGTGSVDWSFATSADGQGNVYVSGRTEGNLEGTNAGENDAFISKYDEGGILQWTRQIGTSSDDRAYSVSADGLGNVYLSGFTEGSLAAPNAGGQDAILVKFASDLPDPVADFNVDSDVNGDDVDALVREILSGAYDFFFDLTGDEAIDNADLSQWLSDAATANGFNAPYMRGDANLDGTINAADLNALGQNWRGQSNTWQSGDFNADGIVDSRDLNEIGQNWRSTIPSAASLESVPEPAASTLLFLGILATPLLRVSGPARRPVARHRRRCVASEA